MLSSKIGILGGGQLGLMLLQASLDWNLDIRMMDADPQAPCRHLVSDFTVSSIQDYEAVVRFGRDLDLITIEIEKVNIDALEELERLGKKVYPEPSVLRIIQDKRTQKEFFEQNGLPTAPFVLTENNEEARKHTDFLPAFHKIGKDGYDGHGVKKIEGPHDWPKAFDSPGVLEKAIPFDKELAVIVARNNAGEMQTFPVVEMVFHPEQHLVEFLFAPAVISKETEAKAVALAKDTARAFGITGLLAVEMFLTQDGDLLINEVAPRPHNSGHHTIRANVTSQFEQHWRAILGLPLGNTSSYSPAAMVNLLGEAGFEGPARYEGMEKILAEKGVFPFLYGKKITRPYRKMGHVTLLGTDLEEIKRKSKFIKDNLRVIS